jgi:hypothetical protein
VGRDGNPGEINLRRGKAIGPCRNWQRIACGEVISGLILRPMSSEGVKAFIARWAAASASERANSQPFLCELCHMLGVATPEPPRETGYAFECDVIPDGSTTKGRIDLYKRQCFVLESKQFQAAKEEASQLELAAQETGVIEKKKSSQPVRGTEAWDDAMIKRFARARAAHAGEILETL